MIHASLVLQELKKLNVTHVVGLPDNSSAALITLLGCDPDMNFVAVAREGEAFAIAAGLWIGGKTPVVLIQNTGFLESGDGFRGTAVRMRIPLLCLITYRGYRKLRSWQVRHGESELNADTLSCAGQDSAALVTEPTLAAWGVPFDFLNDDGCLMKIAEAFNKANAQLQPVAVMVTDELG